MKNLRALSISTILTFILIVFLTIYSELNENFKNMLAGIFGHHWVTKGIFSLIFFFLIYFILSKLIKDDEKVNNQINWVVVVTILCGLVIFLFYVYEFIK